MKSIDIFDWSSFHDAIQNAHSPHSIYRGVRDFDKHVLIPSLGRIQPRKSSMTAGRTHGEAILFEEGQMLSKFKERAIPHLGRIPISEWDWLAIAQHHGLPTRLLDWSLNPLAAAWFATAKAFDADSTVYCWILKESVTAEEQACTSPLTFGRIAKYYPDHNANRISAQSSLFTVHPQPWDAVANLNEIVQLRIKNSFRGDLKRILYRYGVNAHAMFPDLDGLSRHLHWICSESY